MSGAATPSATARPRKPRVQLRTHLLVVALVAFTVFAAREIGFQWRSFAEMWTNPLWHRFWPVPWDWVLNRRNVLDPLVETFQIAILSTVIGCALALPIGFARSKLTTPNAPTFWLSRTVMSVLRAIPDLMWGKLLVTAIGIGAFAGAWALTIFSLAVMVKLFSMPRTSVNHRRMNLAL